MNPYLNEIAHQEQADRLRDATHLRAVKIYRRNHPIERGSKHPEHSAQHGGRAKIASLLRRWASKIDGRQLQLVPPLATPRSTPGGSGRLAAH